jgi:hypothetical protein
MNIPSYDDWIASERVTGAKLNKNIRDAGNFHKAKPAAFAFVNAAGVTIPVGTAAWTTLSVDAEKFDNDNMFSTAGRITIQTPGLYYIEGQARYAAGGTGYRAARIQINNATDLDTQYSPVSPSGATTVYIKGYAQLVAGDFLVVSTLHSESGAAQTVNTGKDHYCYLRAVWVNA